MSEAPPALSRESKLVKPEASTSGVPAPNPVARAAIPAAKGPTAQSPVNTAMRAAYWRPSFRVARVGLDDALVVRSGPSEYHAAIGSIPADGYGVQIVGDCHDLWCLVRHNRTTGWVNRYYLAEEIAPSATEREPQ